MIFLGNDRVVVDRIPQRIKTLTSCSLHEAHFISRQQEAEHSTFDKVKLAKMSRFTQQSIHNQPVTFIQSLTSNRFRADKETVYLALPGCHLVLSCRRLWWQLSSGFSTWKTKKKRRVKHIRKRHTSQS